MSNKKERLGERKKLVKRFASLAKTHIKLSSNLNKQFVRVNKPNPSNSQTSVGSGEMGRWLIENQ